MKYSLTFKSLSLAACAVMAFAGCESVPVNLNARAHGFGGNVGWHYDAEEEKRKREAAEQKREHRAWLASLTPEEREAYEQQQAEQAGQVLSFLGAALGAMAAGGGDSSSSSGWTEHDQTAYEGYYAPQSLGGYGGH